ncbi:MAG: DNA-binding transcriptional regulator AraC [Lentisphaerae bacterium ADurb.Bin242]|nr:MAG: DNA-binding transcriptional regulator AraC [Lentisphaerae bacterium ADurb.Bin242]
MKQNFYNWNLTESHPVHMQFFFRRALTSMKDMDFHRSIHLNIQIAGDESIRICNAEILLKNIDCLLTAPWEPHGHSSSRKGMVGLMTALHPEKLAGEMLGEKAKFDALLSMPPEKRQELIRKYVPKDKILRCLENLLGKSVLDRIGKRWKRGQVSLPWLDSNLPEGDYLHSWHAVVGLVIDIVSTIPPDRFSCSNSRQSFQLYPAFELLGTEKFHRITAEEAAEVCNVSVSGFRKKFIEMTGVPFAEFELNYRFSQAVSELHDNRLLVKEIAEKYGFYDISHFIRLFKKKHGISTRKFMKSPVQGFRS